jgi:hypothetical protein
VARLSHLSQRVSDAEREQKVLSLRDHLLAGRLTLDEFSERVEVAYGARTAADLVKVGEDLPAAAAGAVGSRRPVTRITTAFFGHVVRRGRLRLSGRSFAICAFADLDLDLREAEIDDSETSVTVLVGFGNVDVYVPEGVNVDTAGITIFGRRREWGRDGARDHAPTIHVRTLGCFGTIDVWRVAPQMGGSYGEILHQVQEQQRQLPELSE